MLGKAAGIDPPPQCFDVVRIAPLGIAREDILDHLGNKVRIEWHAIGLAQTADAASGGQLDEHEIASAKVRRRIADDEGLDAGQLHDGTNPLITLISRKSRRPYSPYSRPLPDCL